MSAAVGRLEDARRLLRLRDLRLHAATAAFAAAVGARAEAEHAVGQARARLGALERERERARAELCAQPWCALRLARVGSLAEACREAGQAVCTAEASLAVAEAEVREKAGGLQRARMRRDALADHDAALARTVARAGEEREVDELADMRMRV